MPPHPPHALSPQPRTRLPDRQHYGLQIAERATKDALLIEEQEVKGILSEHAAIKVRTHSSTHTLAPTLPCAHMARGNGGLSTSSCSNDVHVRRMRCIMPVYSKQANAEAQSRTHIYIHTYIKIIFHFFMTLSYRLFKKIGIFCACKER